MHTPIYLRLFHGRPTPDMDLDDWGSVGPTIGPLKSVHMTYTSTLQLDFYTAKDAKNFGFDDTHCWLSFRGDCLEFGSVYYGDWVIDTIPPTPQYNVGRPAELFNPN